MNTLTISQLFSVKGKTVLVTGGSRGIGLMIAQAYVANGAKVYISSRKAAVCEAVATALTAESLNGGQCIALPADLSTNEGREALVATLTQNEESLDILFNNAGATWGAPFAEFPEIGYDKTMDINVKAIFMLTRDLLPLLKAAAKDGESSRIINIGSIDGIHVPIFDNAPYAVSKAAVHQLTRVLASSLGRENITVNAIAPGFFPSKMTQFMIDDPEGLAKFEAECPLGRVGTPEDMGGLALFLGSRAGAYMNGAIIPIDGGTVLGR
jgi:NAD(P)-dependent dehydrogenase (short-subunit alcohol dehydrogenase family)